MSAQVEKTILDRDKKWFDGDSVDDEVTFSREFDPKKTAAKDAKEIVSKYSKEIKEAITS